MTEKPYSLSTRPIVSPSQTTAISPKSTPILLSHVSSKAETVDEEPYTIKCICNFSGDDGYTIFCDTCETWQHLHCFYPHNREDAQRPDFQHSCHDCKPRPLDRQLAIDYQRKRKQREIDIEETTDKKSKRPPSKSHKKKTKPNDLQLNGHSGSDSNTKQQDPTRSHQHKKSKSTHRPSQSISSQPPKRSPSYGQKNGVPHGHPPSPATTPPDVPAELEIHQYSNNFMTLYSDERDPHAQIVQSNSWATLNCADHISRWLQDHEKLKRETDCDFNDVFQRLPQSIDSLKRTPVVEHKKHSVGDTVVRFPYLTTTQAVEKDVPLIELNGQIGIQKDYCADPDNRYSELCSPLPFVFFHPMLPLFIDTRKEGSEARYVRRSCKPNALLDTYLLGSQCHFWLVSDRGLSPNEQITIPWDFRLPKPEGAPMLRLIGMGDDDSSSQPDFDPNQVERYNSMSHWLYQILSEYGGCACDLGPDCAFARFHRKYISRTQSKSNNSKKKPRKPKTHAMSPTSIGHATNSRAPSEGHGDDGGENDYGSSRSKPPSRDMTPARQGSFDTLGILTEPTDRDKRKVAMVEDSFRRMEQQQPPRKKKRPSDGTASSGTSKHRSRNSTSHSQGLPNGTTERRYVDAGTNRSMSGSPSSAVSPNTANPGKQATPRRGSIPIPSRHSSQGPRSDYRDASIQTDSVDGEWFSPTRQTSSKPKRRLVSLSKRLLENRHRVRADEERRRLSVASPTSVASAMMNMGLDSPQTDQMPRLPSPDGTKDHQRHPASTETAPDTVMTDAPSFPSTERKASLPLTSSDSDVTVKTKSPELRVQMPPVPAFNNTNTTMSNSTSPISAKTSVVQSPFSASNAHSLFGSSSANCNTVTPSPVKKKLSLSDYTKSRMNKAAAKPVGASLKPPSAIAEDGKSPAPPEVPMLDSSIDEKTAGLR